MDQEAFPDDESIKKYTIPKKKRKSQLLQQSDTFSQPYVNAHFENRINNDEANNSKSGMDGEGVLEKIPFYSREWQMELLPVLRQSFRQRECCEWIEYLECNMIRNEYLNAQFDGVRRKWKQNSYTDKELEIQYAFLPCLTRGEIDEVTNYGFRSGNLTSCLLGRPDLAVVLNRFFDFQSPASVVPGVQGVTIMCKYLKGKVKSVPVSVESENLEPTPHYNCHMSKSLPSEINQLSTYQIYKHLQVYLYNYNEESDLDVDVPLSHVCPVAVIHWQCRLNLNLSNVDQPQFRDFQHLLWQGNLRLGHQRVNSSLFSNFTKMKPFGLCRSIYIRKMTDWNSVKKWSSVRELLELGNLLYRKREIKLNNNQFVTYCRITGTGNDSIEFKELVTNMQEARVVSLSSLCGGTCLLLMPTSELTIDLGIPSPPISQPVLHCLFFSYRSNSTGIEVVHDYLDWLKEPSIVSSGSVLKQHSLISALDSQLRLPLSLPFDQPNLDIIKNVDHSNFVFASCSKENDDVYNPFATELFNSVVPEYSPVISINSTPSPPLDSNIVNNGIMTDEIINLHSSKSCVDRQAFLDKIVSCPDVDMQDLLLNNPLKTSAFSSNLSGAIDCPDRPASPLSELRVEPYRPPTIVPLEDRRFNKPPLPPCNILPQVKDPRKRVQFNVDDSGLKKYKLGYSTNLEERQITDGNRSMDCHLLINAKEESDENELFESFNVPVVDSIRSNVAALEKLTKTGQQHVSFQQQQPCTSSSQKLGWSQSQQYSQEIADATQDRTVSSTTDLQEPGTGIIVTDDLVLLRAAPEMVENVLSTFVTWRDRYGESSVWKLKLHSQAVLQLAESKKNMDSKSEAYDRVSKLLVILTKYRKLGVVDLLSKHDCDASARPAIHYLPCVKNLKSQINPDHMVMLTNLNRDLSSAHIFESEGAQVCSLIRLVEVYIKPFEKDK